MTQTLPRSFAFVLSALVAASLWLPTLSVPTVSVGAQAPVTVELA